MSAYVNSHALATTEWLAAHLGDADVRILDARFDVRPTREGSFEAVPGRDAYAKAHIPGAQFVDLNADLIDPDEPLHILPAEGFEALMSRLGVGPDTTVVVYDDRGGTWAARVWWALRYHGHDRVMLLDGGFAAWNAGGHPVDAELPVPEPARFRAKVRPELRVTREDVERAIGRDDTCIIDALPEPFFTGEASLYPSHRAGHIAGARNVPAPSHLDPATGRMLAPEALERCWQNLPLAAGHRLITYCGAGVFAAFTLFALYLQGHEDVALYDASWMEWGAAPELPIETGPEAAVAPSAGPEPHKES